MSAAVKTVTTTRVVKDTVATKTETTIKVVASQTSNVAEISSKDSSYSKTSRDAVNSPREVLKEEAQAMLIVLV